MELTEGQRKALKRLKVRSFRQDLRRFSPERIREEFGAKSSGRVLLAPLIRNLVFQAASWMIDGVIPTVKGNLRSLYYQWIKPVIWRVTDSYRVDPYDKMSDALEIFVTKLHLFHYRDLGLIDENWENRWFTDGRNPHLLVFSEKTGFVFFLQQIQRQYGLTAVALGGSPSHLSTEFLCFRLKEQLRELEPLLLFGITDFDPSGFFIQRSFQSQLENQGIEVHKLHSLIEPSHYTEEELEYFSFPVPSRYKARISSWMEESGGIAGEPFGLEADSMPQERLQRILSEEIRPYLRG